MTTNAPTRRDAAVLSARRRLALASGSRADRTSQCAVHRTRATRHAHNLARRSLSHMHTHRHESSDAPRAARSQPTTASHSLPARATTAPHKFAAHHAPAHCAPSPHHTRAHKTVRNTLNTHHDARHPTTTPHNVRRSLSQTHTHHHERRRARCSRLPPPPRTCLRLARRPHRTVRSTPTHAAHCAPSTHHTRAHKTMCNMPRPQHNACHPHTHHALAKHRIPQRSPSAEARQPRNRGRHACRAAAPLEAAAATRKRGGDACRAAAPLTRYTASQASSKRVAAVPPNRFSRLPATSPNHQTRHPVPKFVGETAASDR